MPFILKNSTVRFEKLVSSKFSQYCKDKFAGFVGSKKMLISDSLYVVLKTASVGAAALFGIAATLRGGRNFLSYFFGDSNDGTIQYGESYRSFKERAEKFRPGKPIQWKTSKIWRNKGQFLAPNSAALKRLVTKQIYQFVLDKKSHGYVTAICEDVFVCPLHFRYQMKWRLDNHKNTLSDTILLRNVHDPGEGDILVPITIFNDGFGYEERDLYAFRIPGVPFKKNIIGSFASRSSIENSNYEEAAMHTWVGVETTPMSQTFTSPVELAEVQRYGGVGIPDIEAGPCYLSSMPTVDGDCGAPVIARDVKRNSDYIVALHVAGAHSRNRSGRLAISSVVTNEDLVELLRDLDTSSNVEVQMRKPSTVERPVPQLVDTSTAASTFGRTFVRVDAVGPSVNRPPGSSIVPSRLQLPWRAQKVPARLSVNKENGDDPMRIAISRYSTVPKIELDYQTIRACVQDYFRLLKEGVDQDLPDLSPISFEEACAGIEGDDFAKGISRSSSPGYPYSQWTSVRKCGGKKSFFGSDGPYEFNSQDSLILSKVVREFLDGTMLEQCGEVSCVFQDTLKDELVSKAKFDSSKTRLVSACPLHVTIAWRMLMLKFISYFNTKRFDFEHGVGINVVSNQWAKLQSHLLKTSKSFLDGDLSGFDTSQHPDIQNMIFDELIGLLGIESGPYASAINSLRSTYIRTTHICGDEFYSWPGSLPSGHPLTITFNCIYLSIAYRCAWVYNGGKLSDFRKQVSLIVYGDDSLCAIKPGSSDFFNHKTISRGMQSIGLTYTDANKSEDLSSVDFKDINDVTFLKRSFKYHIDFGQVMAPLVLDTIKERVCWTFAKGDFMDLVQSRCEDSILDLVLHGRDVWEDLAPPIIRAFSKKFGKSLPHTTWELALLAVKQQVQNA